MEEKRDKWLNFLALTTVIIALGATMSTLSVGKFSNRGILKQTQASNQWAYYQAKSIKAYLYELQKEKLETDLKLSPNIDEGVRNEYEQKITKYGEQIRRYEQEKIDIQTQAQSLEKERDQAMVHSQQFGLAVIFLQLAILMSSIASLMKKKLMWVVGLLVGLLGFLYFANGYLLLF
ncbi:MAG: hypothetical protein QG663_1471 [Thermodesulfobacteriota bacterium]|nr:hypothetical protein [Thermodesulfobacteriota bacterium]